MKPDSTIFSGAPLSRMDCLSAFQLGSRFSTSALEPTVRPGPNSCKRSQASWVGSSKPGLESQLYGSRLGSNASAAPTGIAASLGGIKQPFKVTLRLSHTSKRDMGLQ